MLNKCTTAANAHSQELQEPRPPGAMQLRTHGHQFELPATKYKFNKRNFIFRSLFNYV